MAGQECFSTCLAKSSLRHTGNWSLVPGDDRHPMRAGEAVSGSLAASICDHWISTGDPTNLKTMTSPGRALAHLKGFIFQPGYLPEDNEDEGYFDVFDERSQHAAIGYRILVNDRELVAKALKMDAELDELSAVAHLERLWVNPSLRGHGIAHRLLREAQHVLGRPGLLVMVKAHPDDVNF